MSRPNRQYPYGRDREDTIAQPFKDRDYAWMFAKILERLTGEQCDVVILTPYQRVLRRTGERWIKA